MRQANVKTGDVNPNLFEDDAEKAFCDCICKVKSKFENCIHCKNCEDALCCLETLRAPADAFFDAVLVNAENEDVRMNRLALLSSVEALFSQFCDVRKL